MNGNLPDPHRMSPERRASRRALVPGAPKTPASGGSPKHDRHAAITDNLSKWQNYKRWTEKIRNTWSAPEKLDE
jgi:hypothetical protein